jgi:hypothetical protein
MTNDMDRAREALRHICGETARECASEQAIADLVVACGFTHTLATARSVGIEPQMRPELVKVAKAMMARTKTKYKQKPEVVIKRMIKRARKVGLPPVTAYTVDGITIHLGQRCDGNAA